MAQDQVIIRRSGHQILDELDATDIPALAYDATGAAAAAQAASQPLDAELTAIAGLTSAANKGIQFTGSGTAGVYDLTTAGKALLDDAAASDQRTTLGLGTLATQSGTFSGTSSGTNTGDQALPTRASLGLDTFDLPQFLEVNVGHASDTTITRLGPGDVGVEGNRLYHAGGTDVPVADGGTGASTASGARTNLGLVIGTDVRAQGSGDPVERAAASTTPAAVGTAAVGTGTTDARADHVHATGASTPSTQAFGDAAATGSGPAAAMTDHKHAMPALPAIDATAAATDITTRNVSTTAHGLAPKLPNDATKYFDGIGGYSVPPGTGGASGGTPATVIGTAGAAGSAGTFLRTDDTLGILDATVPVTQAFGDAAATGSVAKAARRDHVHGMPANPAAVWPAIPLKLSAAINFDWSHMQMIAIPGSATRVVSGLTTPPGNSGTITSGDDADGAWNLLTSAASANNEATMYSPTQFRRDWGAIASGVFKTPSAFAVGVWEAGFSSAAMGTAAVPATHCAIFRYSTAVDGTAFWRTVTNNAGTGTVTATSVAVAVSTVYRWVIRLLPSSVEYYLATADGALALVDTCSATLPTATTALALITRVLTLENVAKTILWGRYTILTRP